MSRGTGSTCVLYTRFLYTRFDNKGLPHNYTSATHRCGLRVPLGLKGWALGRLRLKRLKTGHGQF